MSAASSSSEFDKRERFFFPESFSIVIYETHEIHWNYHNNGERHKDSDIWGCWKKIAARLYSSLTKNSYEKK